MHKSRLEAFSEGVLAIIITIMVLELKVPHSSELWSLIELLPTFISYAISFIYIAIYWNNHHHLFQIVKHVNGPILWANAHLLFWLSIVPFVTAWSGENHFAAVPVALYGIILFLAGASYYILTLTLLAAHGKESDLAKAIGKDIKGKISMVLYAAAIPIAFYAPYLALFIYILVAAMWFIPDKRIEKTLNLMK